jgi:proline dehydrogenase
MKGANIDFADTKVAFENQSTIKLKNNYAIFALMNKNWLVKIGTFFINVSLKLGLPIKKIIKGTIFELFCGGETIEDCKKTIKSLNDFSIGTILDYSVEGEDDEDSFDKTKNEILASIHYAKNHRKEIPFSVFKITGIGSRELLAKVQEGKFDLNDKEKAFFENFNLRFSEICKTAAENGVRLFVDAEESWIQNVIDDLILEKMKCYNILGKILIYNTYQLYRKNSLGILEKHIQTAKEGQFGIGAKLVRGAYMEKERNRAEVMNYPDPINETKELTDQHFNAALEVCFDNIDVVGLCSGTHNEKSCKLGIDLIVGKGLDVEDSRVYFAQLLGMSDNISYNLSKNGFNVAKYVPYGPIASVMPYLIRRAEENTSIAGQSSREFLLIKKELKRRKKA